MSKYVELFAKMNFDDVPDLVDLDYSGGSVQEIVNFKELCAEAVDFLELMGCTEGGFGHCKDEDFPNATDLAEELVKIKNWVKLEELENDC